MRIKPNICLDPCNSRASKGGQPWGS
eukprot:SAG25_NODE_14154_length_258_cov_0.849057_1_plen_25_part_01